MWIVRIALSRPYTFIVLALLILILGPLSILRTPTDIFPNINIPVVSVVWSYTGMPPKDMSNLITGIFERAISTTVNDIEHIESQSLSGVAVIKIFFHPSTEISIALAQVTAISQTLLRQLPPGTTPPLILSYNASTVPVLQLVLSSTKLSEQNLNDIGNNLIRTQLATVQGAALPYAYGGKVRQIMVDINQKAMQANNVSSQDINIAMGAQNLILPAGTQKIGYYEYYVKLNASPYSIDELNNLPLKVLKNNTVLYIRDVAHVRDGYAPQTNIVRINGSRAVLMSIQKTGNASTLDIVNRVKQLIPKILQSTPPSLNLSLFSDQSIFVKAAINDVIREGVIAATLTGLMILLFVGSWHSTAIITISIPLSILSSIIVLYALGETINIMTLGGLALAVGILVDDATVAIENINWNLEQGKKIEPAILDGAQQIAVPALVSTLCICIVFVPMFFMKGVAYYLFVPLAKAVIFAMLASYILSRTLVATLAKYWLKTPEIDHENPSKKNNFFLRFQSKFEEKFHDIRLAYSQSLTSILNYRSIFILGFLIFVIVSLILLAPWTGSDFFPNVDAGQIKLHVHGATGTRVEETARNCDKIDNIIRQAIPSGELDSIVDNIGLPVSGINLTYSNSAPVGPADADILISLNEYHHATANYIHILRNKLREQMPGMTFAFLPADIVSQILNFGLPAPINVQIIGLNIDDNRQYAGKLLRHIQKIPGITDARIQQAFNYPQLNVISDRTLAQELGITQLNIASSMLITLSGSFQTSPNFWVDPKNNVAYPVVTQAPQYAMNSLESLRNIPIAITGKQLQILGALSKIERDIAPVVVSHYNAQPVIDIFASVQDRDLGGVAHDVNKIISKTAQDVPKGSSVIARGQMETQATSFKDLYAGIFFAIIFCYLIIVVNFQSWIDPFIIISALPASLAGIIWILFLTHTTLSVPALTGAIMCMGVATANSILIISFAKQRMQEGEDAIKASISAGYTRLRPVIMTALAMIIGMLPMALGLGEGGEQNAPLGRAVIGGLTFATFATLFFVPCVFCLFHYREKNIHAE